MNGETVDANLANAQQILVSWLGDPDVRGETIPVLRTDLVSLYTRINNARFDIANAAHELREDRATIGALTQRLSALLERPT